MLTDFAPRVSEFDRQIYRLVVPPDHFLRKVSRVVPWDTFHALLAPYYKANLGRPAESPVLMLKLEYLRYHHNWSDREVIARATTDLACREFLGLPLRWSLPDPSSLCIFRGRLGPKGYRQIFDAVVRAAREQGVVKDRLRIKDATHVIANIAVPTALALVAQTRDRLLALAEPFAPLLVAGERIHLETLRETTKTLPPPERLVTRVAQLREMLIWAEAVAPPAHSETNPRWPPFLAQLELARKILADQDQPATGDRTRSTTDPDARRAKHGVWFDGYLTDITLDADSEIITAVNVLPANGNEGADATELIRLEETAQGNDVQALSIDGAGYNGAVLRELQNPAGLNIDTYVPPKSDPETELFTPKDFSENAERNVVTCPAGQTSKYAERDNSHATTVYRFAAAICHACPLLLRCLKQPPQAAFGRTVRKSDYQVEYQRVRDKAATPAYAQVRQQHSKVERKLGEIMNRHGGRRARYRGRWKVLIQELMACTATNLKRLVRLCCAPTAANAASA